MRRLESQDPLDEALLAYQRKFMLVPPWMERLVQQQEHWYEPNGAPRVMGCACHLCAPNIT